MHNFSELFHFLDWKLFQWKFWFRFLMTSSADKHYCSEVHLLNQQHLHSGHQCFIWQIYYDIYNLVYMGLSPLIKYIPLLDNRPYNVIFSIKVIFSAFPMSSYTFFPLWLFVGEALVATNQGQWFFDFLFTECFYKVHIGNLECSYVESNLCIPKILC